MSDSSIPQQDPARALEDWLERLEVLHPKKIDLSLERVKRVLEALGLTRPPYPVLTVGGTNGKGSCVAVLESIYGRAGYRVASYTSPHLWRFNERIRIDGIEATDAEIVAAFEEIDRARGPTTLSYFEYATVAACLWFAHRNGELAVLEVGLGGRLDAVNALDAQLALITSVDLDHQYWLGATREAIGREKAGIMRAERPAILADRNPPASVIEHAVSIEAVLLRLGSDFDFVPHEDGSWDYHGRTGVLPGLPRPAPRGGAQYGNAAAGLAAVEAMQPVLPVDERVLGPALTSVRLAGRLERVSIAGVEWLFDVAHNPAAAVVLATELTTSAVAGRTLAVVGLMADKDVRGVLGPLAGLVDEWVVTRAASERACAPDRLLAVLGEIGAAQARPGELHHLVEIIARTAEPGDRVVVFGSFQVVGPVMAALKLYCRAYSSGAKSAKWTGV